MPWDPTRVESNQYDQVQCFGCRELGPLFAQLRQNSKVEFESSPVIIHRTCRELATCAKRCIACQIFHRGLLLEQITVQGSSGLEHEAGVIHASVSKKQGDDINIRISLGSPGMPNACVATILCTQEDVSTHNQGIAEGADWTQLRRWISACDSKHACRNYRWSNKNPTWLIKILPNERIQLVKGSEAGGPKGQLVGYVALSYCWGDQKTITAKDPQGWERVQRAHTRVLAKGQPVKERLHPFSRMEYPETLRDAIYITEKLGREYIWVDSVCIPELDDWDVEASKMHEVYGNADFTLFTCSADKAVDQLCIRRDAWQHPVKACRLFGYWLANRDPTLAEMRRRNPLAQRGWILQEERLSPRILFWCAQRAYWSCCERQATESKQSTHNPGPDISSVVKSRPQDFMVLTRSGNSEKLHEEWLDLVAAYTTRNLAEQGKEKDRFRAFSGLAVRYLSAGNQDAVLKNEYLAGLWRESFACHLAWRVKNAVRPEGNLRNVAPTWSWASLPLCTDVDLRHHFDESEYFTLMESNRVTDTDTERDIVTRGAAVKAVRVSGRFRRLLQRNSVLVPWDAVMTVQRNGHEQFNMPLDPSQSVHARSSDGRLVVYEAHKLEMLCQLDYLEPAEDEEKQWTATIPQNTEAELHCLEVGKSSMLVLDEVEAGSDRFRRAGVGHGYRQNFFDGHEVRVIVLD